MNRYLSIALMVMLLITTLALFATKERTGVLPPDSSSGKPSIGGVFSLTDTNGKTVHDSDFRGKQMLVFFGFTRCPEICPTTMATITSAMQMLGDKADRIVPVFISIDPGHDTPEQMRDYLSNFDKRIVGLTGSEDQVKDAAAVYKAYYAQEGEMMNHSTLLYWMDEKGEYITHFPYTISPDGLATALAKDAK